MNVLVAGLINYFVGIVGCGLECFTSFTGQIPPEADEYIKGLVESSSEQ